MPTGCTGTTIPVKGTMDVDANPPHRPVVGHLVWCIEHEKPVKRCKAERTGHGGPKGSYYRSLLKKYLNHVGQAEGIFYVDVGGGFTDVDFTDEELEEIRDLIEEVQDERY